MALITETQSTNLAHRYSPYVFGQWHTFCNFASNFKSNNQDANELTPSILFHVVEQTLTV